jgi:hypothetical protein
VAEQELKAKCPEFDPDAFIRHGVMWSQSAETNEAVVIVTYLSRHVTDVKQWSPSPTDGNSRTEYTHWTASVWLSNSGMLLEQNRSEWPDVREMVKVYYSTVYIVTTNTHYLSDNGFDESGNDKPHVDPPPWAPEDSE